MMLYRNMKVKVRTDEDTEFFDIYAGVLLGDILATYMFIICQDYIIQTPIELIKRLYTKEKSDDIPQKL